MGQLTWQNINTDFAGGGGGRGGSLLLDSFDPLAEALQAYEKKRSIAGSMDETRRALAIDDPEALQRALASGELKVDEHNAEFFRTRTSDMLANQLAKLTQTKTGVEIEGAKLDNQGKVISNRQSEADYSQDITEFGQKQDQLALQPEVAKRLGMINDLATTNYKGAMALIDSPETQEMLAKANITPQERDRMRSNLASIASGTRTQDTEEKDKIHLEKGRGTKEQNELTAEQYKGAGAARTEALDIADDAAALAQKALTERMRPGTEADTIHDADRARTDKTRKELLADAQFEDDAKKIITLKNADKLVKKYGNVGDPEDVELAIRSDPDATAEEIEAAASAYAKVVANQPKVTADQFFTNQQLADPNGPTGPRIQRDYTTVRPQIRAAADSILAGGGVQPAVQPGSQPGSLVNLVDRTEGGADYRALYGQSQRPGGQFEGVDVTRMTISDLNKFANSGYGQHVASQNNGTFATPMGRFQIVNTTLQNAAKEMGLDLNTTIFNEQTQNAIFNHLVQKRIGGPRTMEAKMAGLRQEWAGFKNVDDQTLAGAITSYERGDQGGLLGAMQGSEQPPAFAATPQAPVDETFGPAADAAIAEFSNTIKDRPLNFQENKIVEDNVDAIETLAAKTNDSLQSDTLFGGSTASIMAAIKDPKNQTISALDAGKQIAASAPDIQIDQITDDINYISRKYSIPPGIAAAFVASAPEETHWIASDFLGYKDKRHINRDEMDKTLRKFVDPDEKDPNKKAAGMMAFLEQDRAKTTASGTLANAQATTRANWENYLRQATLKQKDPSINDKRAYDKLQLAIKKEQAIMAEIAAQQKLLNAQQNASNPG